MKTIEMNLHVPRAMSWKTLFAAIQPRAWIANLNWYQVTVVAVATFAIAMDLMFPPVRISIGNGFEVYAGHAYVPLSTAVAVRVDFMWLALELLVIIAAAVVGWCIGTPSGSSRKSTSGTT